MKPDKTILLLRAHPYAAVLIEIYVFASVILCTLCPCSFRGENPVKVYGHGFCKGCTNPIWNLLISLLVSGNLRWLLDF